MSFIITCNLYALFRPVVVLSRDSVNIQVEASKEAMPPPPVPSRKSKRGRRSASIDKVSFIAYSDSNLVVTFFL